MVDVSGAFYNGGINYGYSVGGGISVYAGRAGFDASRCSSIYGNSEHVNPLSQEILFLIRY